MDPTLEHTSCVSPFPRHLQRAGDWKAVCSTSERRTLWQVEVERGAAEETLSGEVNGLTSLQADFLSDQADKACLSALLNRVVWLPVC
jgi:hypothetical protein